MRFSVRQSAVEIDPQVGSEVPMTIFDVPAGVATVVAAEVSDDGAEVVLTYEAPVRIGCVRGFGDLRLAVSLDGDRLSLRFVEVGE